MSVLSGGIFFRNKRSELNKPWPTGMLGGLLLPPADNQEFMPLPQDCSKPAVSPSPQALS